MKRPAILILLFMLPSLFACDCMRTYTFQGIVTDAAFHPLEGVEVRLSDGDHGGDVLLGITDPQGRYDIVKESLGMFADGKHIEFVKTGYQTAISEPFNASEAGCGANTLVRDAILSTQ